MTLIMINLNNSGSKSLAPCPVYANKGCFTSISRHTENGVEIDGKWSNSFFKYIE